MKQRWVTFTVIVVLAALVIATGILVDPSVSQPGPVATARGSVGKVIQNLVPWYGEASFRGFWTRKTVEMVEVTLYVTGAVLLSILLDVTGISRLLGWLLWPFISLGKLGRDTAPAFVTALQSGAAANSMLLASRKCGAINNRQLYSSVLVVSNLAMVMHLPGYLIAVGAVTGSQGFIAVTAVRIGAVILEVFCIMLVSRMLSFVTDGKLAAPFNGTDNQCVDDEEMNGRGASLRRAWKTLARIYRVLVPVYIVIGMVQYAGLFQYLGEQFPALFSLDFLPPQAGAVIAAQAVNIYAGAASVAGFIQAGSMTPKTAVLVLLTGSIVTAPVRTLRRVLPAYMGIFGVKAGPVLGVSAQVLRMAFLALGVYLLMIVW